MQTQGNAIRYGTIGTSPNRVFVVDWAMDVVAQGGADVINAQMQIHETSNLIHVRYRDGGNSNANGQAATIGFQGAGGSNAAAYPITCNGKVMDDNQSDESWSVHPKAGGAMSLHSIMAHSPDDITGFTSLSGDDNTATATIPFNVRIDGVNYTTVAISTNGWLELGGNTQGTSDPNNSALPTAGHTNPFLAAFWDNLVPRAASSATGRSAEPEPHVHRRRRGVHLAEPRLVGGRHPVAGRDPRDVEHHQREVPHRPALCRRPDRDDRLQGAGRERDRVSVGVEREDARRRSPDRGLVGGAAADLRQRHRRDEGAVRWGGANGATTRAARRCARSGRRQHVPLVGGRLRRRGDVHWRGGRLPPTASVGATVCRSSVGQCDVAENCTGSGAACPGDAVRPTSFFCRSSAGVCDLVESCDGVTTTCPADGFQSSATVCRSSAGVCDVAENCTGSGVACPGDAFQSSSTVCRSSAGVCDVAESCTGSGAACPANGFVSSSTVCRSSAGVCDVAESCTGSSAGCPADQVVSSSTVCRSSAGVCDVAENCDGSTVSCPADAKASSGTVCRSSAGVCDVAEACDGASDACPADAFASSSTRAGRAPACATWRRIAGLRRGVSDRCLRDELGRVPQRGRRLRRGR